MLYIKYLLYSAALIILSACSGQPHVVEKRAESNDSSLAEIFIVNHGWHTGIITPAQKIITELPQLKARFSGADYLEFGWGDQGFYQAEEITSGITINAILWPTESVVHVVALRDSVQKYFSRVHALCISENEFNALTTFLAHSFIRDSTGDISSLSKGIYGDSQFYRGSGSYHLFNTCNKWTAKGLKSAGFDISPALKLTAQSIMDYLAVYAGSTCK